MKRPLELRSRMMLLSCAAVGVLLAGSFLILYAWLARNTSAEDVSQLRVSTAAFHFMLLRPRFTGIW